MTSLRVTLAEDSVLLRTGMARILQDAGFDVLGQAGDGDELMRMVERNQPDVVVLDIRMPPTHTDEGIVVAAALRDRYPGVGVLVLSQYLETALAMRLLGDGTRGVGYLLKDRVTDVAHLGDAIRRVSDGESVIDPDIVARLVARRREHDPLEALTEREREVLSLIAEGRSNHAIAERLCMSPKTVEAHVRSILMKLDITETPEDNRRVVAVLTYLRRS